MAGEVVRAEEDPFVRADGRTQWLRWEVRPWLTRDQAVGGITIMTEDVTERVEAVRALRESELRTRLAQEAAKAGTWEWWLADDRSQWSETLWSLYGLKPQAMHTLFRSVGIIDPSRRSRARHKDGQRSGGNRSGVRSSMAREPAGRRTRALVAFARQAGYRRERQSGALYRRRHRHHRTKAG